MTSKRHQRLQERKTKAEKRKKIQTEARRALWHLKRKQACKNKDVINQRKKLAMRAYRQAIKENPLLYEETKKKERERWHIRKMSGKVKCRADMTEREKRVVKKRTRESTKRYREKKSKKDDIQENIDCEPVEEVECAESVENIPLASVENIPLALRIDRLKKLGRKKKCASRTAAHRRVAKMQGENETLKRALWRAQRRLADYKKELPSTPRSQVRKDTKGKNMDPEIRRKLVFGEVMKQQVNESFDLKSVKEKGAAYQIFRGNLLRKYKLQKASGLSLKMLKKYGREKKSSVLQNDRAMSKKVLQKKKEVEDFFLSDANSIECADTRAVKIMFGKNRVKKRKRYLRGRMSDLYLSYTKSVENPLHYSKFCKYKPFNVVMKDLKERDTCLCIRCENMELLLQSLWQAGTLPMSTNLSLLKYLCCSPTKDECYQRKCEECQANEVVFKPCDDENLEVNCGKWENIVEKKTDSKTGEEREVKRNVRTSKKMTIKTLKENFVEELPKFLAHTFRDRHQLETLKLKRENLSPGEMYIWMDYSENYSCKYSREIQSHYYGASRETVTLHTGVLYQEGEHHPFCTASESARKDPPATIAHLLPVLKKYMKPGITKLHFQSDSPSTQYRNKTMFHVATQYVPKIFPQITSVAYNYTEAGHGKGAPDGIGAHEKDVLDTAVKTGKDVSTFQDVVAVLKEKSGSVFFETADSNKMKEIDQIVPKDIKAFTGTFSVHQFTWCKEENNQVQMNSVSCYQCPEGSPCTHYQLQNSPWMPVHKEIDEEDLESEPVCPARKKRQSNKLPVPVGTVAYNKGEWVAVRYGVHWYPGFVEKVTSLKLSVNFMVKHQRKNKLFLWPPTPDIQPVLKKDVLYKLTQAPQLVDRIHFEVPDYDIISTLML